ncbi:MAG: MATE family efflux transporter [Clostridia bacterium]|nr:MATE family efflux transporter [Clostridia bacterium]
MNGKFGKDLTVGSIPQHLLTFSIPMLVGNLLQTGYSIINTIWVGNQVGEDAVGATAVSFPIVFIMIALASGITLATTILVSQHYGAKEYNMVERVVNNSFALALIIGIILTIAGILSSDFLLRLMNTPPSIFVMASSYLKISLAGFILMYFSFLITSILRGIGDTLTPLFFMFIGIVINAVLDPFLIMGIGPFPKLGLNGAAYASLIAQAVAFILAWFYLNKQNHFVAINPKKFILDKQITLLLFKIGFPSIIQQSLVSIGNAFITTFVNAFGAAAIAAFGAAGRVDSIAFMPAMSLSMAVSALTGQNLGAQKPERVKEIFKWGIVMTSVITIIISVIAVSFPHLILSMFGFGQTESGFQIGVGYLRIVGASYILFAIMFISNGIINGAGHTMTTMMFSLLSLWIVRVPFAWILSGMAFDKFSNSSNRFFQSLSTRIFSHFRYGLTGIWISIVISFTVVMTISLMYYFSGRWKKAVVKFKGTPVPEPEFE